MDSLEERRSTKPLWVRVVAVVAIVAMLGLVISGIF